MIFAGVKAPALFIMSIKYVNAIKVLAVIGVGLALYLYINYLNQPVTTICTINSKVNCDAVISGEVATTLGVPTALYGLVGYMVILIAASLKKGEADVWDVSFWNIVLFKNHFHRSFFSLGFIVRCVRCAS
ncbi:MAG: hypothetical protein KatS3mg101_0159 [Patescibacteria group bacterium]|nr:MAG: hypothetical protein KatS3mg101_0159 [Patescibacteria group bacterium]